MYTWEAYRLMLLVPIVAGALIVALAAGIGDSLDRLGAVGNAIGELALIFSAAPVIVGVPYLAFAVFAANWLPSRPDKHVRHAVNLAPVLFLPLIALFWVAIAALNGTLPQLLQPPRLSFIASGLGVTLGVGYASVALAHFGVFLLRRAGMVDTMP